MTKSESQISNLRSQISSPSQLRPPRVSASPTSRSPGVITPGYVNHRLRRKRTRSRSQPSALARYCHLIPGFWVAAFSFSTFPLPHPPRERVPNFQLPTPSFLFWVAAFSFSTFIVSPPPPDKHLRLVIAGVAPPAGSSGRSGGRLAIATPRERV